MKFPITDQFLWDIYGLLEKADNVLDFILSNKYKQVSILMGDANPVFRRYEKEMGRKSFNNAIYYLKKNNYIKVQNLKGNEAIIITKKGLSKTLKTSFLLKNKKKRKDGKWIMLIFDVPEKNRKSRDLLRSVLHNLGYKMFQKSVWITPFDVSDKTEKLLQIYSLDDFVKIFLIEKLW